MSIFKINVFNFVLFLYCSRYLYTKFCNKYLLITENIIGCFCRLLFLKLLFSFIAIYIICRQWLQNAMDNIFSISFAFSLLKTVNFSAKRKWNAKKGPHSSRHQKANKMNKKTYLKSPKMIFCSSKKCWRAKIC